MIKIDVSSEAWSRTCYISLDTGSRLPAATDKEDIFYFTLWLCYADADQGMSSEFN